MRAAYLLQGLAFLLLVAGAAVLLSRSADAPTRDTKPSVTISPENMMNTSLTLTSSAFSHNARIPSRFTCDGEDVNPALAIDGVPEEAVSLVLIMDDPDAAVGVWDHWVVFNIPPDIRIIEEATNPTGVSGSNSWGNFGWGGPCPHAGEHRYRFTLYALDIMLDLPEGTTKADVERGMQGHILAQTQLIGRYARK